MNKKTTTSSELFDEHAKASEILDQASNEQASQEDATEIAELLSRLKELESKMEVMEKENLTLIADMTNLRRRSDEDIKRSRLYSNQKLIESLLPALDVLDLALALPEEEHTIAALLQGCVMTQTQMNQILGSHGLEKVKTENHTIFNPEEHEAIQTANHEDLPSQCIIHTYQPGYKLNGRVIRTAKVSINSA